MCPIDSNTRRLRSVDSTLFPSDISLAEKVGELEYSKFNFDKNDFTLKKKITIDLSNVDFYMHTNNVEYVRFCLSVLDLKVFENKRVDTFEIHYIKECSMGDEIEIYVNENDNKIDFLFMVNDSVVLKAEMMFADKK